MTMSGWLVAAGIAFVTGITVMLTLKPLVGWLHRRAVLDIPNERSSHDEVVPRGGGIAVIAGVFSGSLLWLAVVPDFLMAFAVTGMAALSLVFWLDDRRGNLPISLRLGAQAVAVGFVVLVLPPDSRIAGGLAAEWLPLWLERILCFFAWLWFINLFNFMDGINGISGLEAAAIGLGLALVSVFDGYVGSGTGVALVLAAAAAGFLPWNWNRAKVFLGDVGSVPLGYLTGWLLLDAALHGQWAAALILPMYYWVDATVTLLRRLWRREKIWQAHRSHFYQQGARRLGSHVAVTTRLLMLNLFLAGMAVASLQSGMMALAATGLAAAAAAGLCRHFAMPANPVE